MQINEDRHAGVVIVTPAGRVDSTTSAALDQHLVALAGAGERRLVIDFAGVDYISSAGLRVLLTQAKRTREHKGGLVLCGLGESVRQVFELAGFLPLFTLTASREEAIARAAA